MIKDCDYGHSIPEWLKLDIFFVRLHINNFKFTLKSLSNALHVEEIAVQNFVPQHA